MAKRRKNINDRNSSPSDDPREILSYPGNEILCQKVEERLAAYDPAVGELELLPPHGVFSLDNINSIIFGWILSELKNLSRLRSLKIKGFGLCGEQARELAESEHLSGLRSLDISNNHIGIEGVKAIAGAQNLRGLRNLGLARNEIGDEGTAALATSRYLGALQSLNVAENSITHKGVKSLVRSENFSNLRFLQITYNLIGTKGARSIAQSKILTRLHTLEIGINALGYRGTKALAESEHLSRLRSLNVGYNMIGTEGAKALAESAHLSGLRILNVCRNGIGYRGAVALGRSIHLSGLHSLHISGNEIGDRGARALAASKHLSALGALDIMNNGIESPQAVIDLCDKIINRQPIRQGRSFRRKSEIYVRLNRLRWNARGGNISDMVINLTNPAVLKKRLEELRDPKNRAQIFAGRIVMSGPTNHGKSHLALWLTAKTELQRKELMRPQLRANDGAGTVGADWLETTLTRSEHKQRSMDDIYLRIIDCGGHVRQLQSHHNLYFSSWNRSVFVLCARADSSYKDSWAEYHLGLIEDLKALSISRRRAREMTVNQFAKEASRPGPADDAERTRLPVLLVATCADLTKLAGRKLEFPSPAKLAAEHSMLDVITVDAWDAISGNDIFQVRRAVGAQLARLPELRAALPKYIVTVRNEIHKMFAPDDDVNQAPSIHSMSFKEFKALCNRAKVKDASNRHLYTLQVLDDMGYVVAPGCHDDFVRDNLVVLNPHFVQRFLYHGLLHPKRRATDGILPEMEYRRLTHDFSVADRSTLESIMKGCLVAFEVRDRGEQSLGWLIPDLLETDEQWPKWPDVLWSADIESQGFLNESTFFRFLRDEQKSIERTIDGDAIRLSLHRNWCVLQDADSRALVRVNVRQRTIDIEVRGGRKEAAEAWCRFLLTRFEKVIGVKGTLTPGPGGRGAGKPVDFIKTKLLSLWQDWVQVRQSTNSTKREFAKQVVAESTTRDKYGLRAVHGERMLIDDVINAIDYAGRLSRGAD